MIADRDPEGSEYDERDAQSYVEALERRWNDALDEREPPPAPVDPWGSVPPAARNPDDEPPF